MTPRQKFIVCVGYCFLAAIILLLTWMDGVRTGREIEAHHMLDDLKRTTEVRK